MSVCAQIVAKPVTSPFSFPIMFFEGSWGEIVNCKSLRATAHQISFREIVLDSREILPSTTSEKQV